MGYREEKRRYSRRKNRGAASLIIEIIKVSVKPEISH